uniref:Uncharacterized protein n=1 Tax=Panagrolaimus davidi TaxID=227884 RepID=A0A914PGU4_9BILA
MCFSIISPETLKDIPKYWIPEVRHFCPNIPFILVGIQKDLRNDPKTIAELARKNHEPVKYKQGKAMAKKIGAFAYVECSAVTKEGVHEVFEKATQVALKMKKKQSCSII